MKAYGIIINQFYKQQLIWNPILQETQRQIEKKQRDISELALVARDSKFSLSSFQNKFNETEAKINQSKMKRDRQLEAKQSQLSRITKDGFYEDDISRRQSKPLTSLYSQSSQLRSRMNKQLREKREEKLLQLTNVNNRIREVFGTNDPKKIKKYFDDKKEANEKLEKQIEDIKKSTKSLQRQVDNLKLSIEESEYVETKGIGANRMLSEGYKLRQNAREKLVKKERKRDVIEEQESIIRKAMNHYAETLKLIIPDNDFVLPTNLEELSVWCLDKIKLAESLIEDEDADYLSTINRQAFMDLSKNYEVDNLNTTMAKKSLKRTLDTIKKPKGSKQEISPRVMNRQMIKQISQKISNQERKKY
ncbi:hypothetical protein GPJ56_003485 [Histomonas meleagridis]|uniref:uncharacterized protein n=1 Tax=Histomonas meleagridis TaxID=135588 RepID=UPI0035593A46|nr:hypothetical protein GPJ56_003485 [Histomonas meleagridis]KAH0799177.1 hypothetical protein GO595_007974 [Histomonas meleagridis]